MTEHTPTDSCWYIVRETWPDQVIDLHQSREYMFFSPVKTFHCNTWQESKKAAETFYGERNKLITLRKLMFPDIDIQHFTITLSFAESESKIGQNEILLEEANENIISKSEDFKAGLFRRL